MPSGLYTAFRLPLARLLAEPAKHALARRRRLHLLLAGHLPGGQPQLLLGILQLQQVAIIRGAPPGAGAACAARRRRLCWNLLDGGSGKERDGSEANRLLWRHWIAVDVHCLQQNDRNLFEKRGQAIAAHWRGAPALATALENINTSIQAVECRLRALELRKSERGGALRL